MNHSPPLIEDEPAAEKGAPPAIRIALKVVPGSRKDEVAGLLGTRLKVKVAAPPEDGKANKAVCRVLAEHLGVSPRAVSIIAGHTSAEKIARVEGLTARDASSLLPL